MGGHDREREIPTEDELGEEAAALNAIWERLGIAGPTDVHVHFLPKSMLDKVWAYFDCVGEVMPFAWPVTYRFDEAARLATLRAFGVQRFTSLVYPHKPDMALWLNGWSSEFAAANSDCIPTGTFYPEPTAGAYVAEAIDGGVRVFKSHIQVGDYSPLDPLLDDVWATLADRGVPTVIHAGNGPAPGRFCGPEPVAELLARHPDLPLIVAHLGLPDYREFLDLAERYDNVWLDTTMALTDFTEAYWAMPPDQVPRLAELGDRVLWGSDYPNIPYAYLHAVSSLERLGFGDGWLANVLAHNAQRLFGTI